MTEHRLPGHIKWQLCLATHHVQVAFADMSLEVQVSAAYADRRVDRYDSAERKFS